MVLDPHDGKSIGISPPDVTADLLFISHAHFDHNAVRSVKGDPKVIQDERQGEVDGVRVRTYLLPHDNVGGQRRGLVRVYRLEMDGASFLFAGDVGDLPPRRFVEQESGASILFLPVGGLFTIGPEEAVNWVEALEPRVVIPMHYRVGGISLSIKPVEDFLAIVNRKILKVGQAVSFQPEDLLGEPLVWVFSR